jgi:hypothetical protein
MIDYTQLSDTELQEAVSFHRRQRNMSRGINEAAHARQAQIVRLMEAEEARRLDESRKALAARKSAERAADQGVRVDKKTYDWGKMVTVHDGIRKSFPLHPEHQEKIKNLKHGESTTFTDETRSKVKAHREGDTVHLQRTDSDKKTSVPYSHFAEEARRLAESEAAYKKADRDEKRKAGAGEYYVTDHNNNRTHSEPFKTSDQAISHANARENKTSRIHTVHHIKNGKIQKQWQYSDSAGRFASYNDHAGQTTNIHEEVEQIDELSSEKKMAYGKAAFADYHKQSKAKLGKILSGDKDTSGESRKIANRLKGISTSSKTEEVELDEISRDLARSYIRKVADKNNTGEASPKEVMKRSPGLSLAGKKAYGIGGKAKVNATEEVDLDEGEDFKKRQSVAGLKKMIDDHDNRAKTTTSPLKKDHHRKMSQQLRDQLADMKEETELDEGVSNLSDARLKFHVLKDIPHGSYTKKELSAEHDRRKKTSGAEYNSVKPSMNEANILPSNFSDRTTPLPNKKAYAVDKANSEKKPVSLKKAPWDVKKEEVDLDEAKTDIYHKHMLKALGKTRLPKDHGYTSSIANNGDFVVRKGGEVAGRIPKGEHDLKEASMTPTDMKQREDIVKGMKKSAQDFKDRYGSKWKSVMYATATKAAMKEESEQIDEAAEKSSE